MIYVSTGVRNKQQHSYSLRDIFNKGCAVLKIYSGTIPANADAAITGNLLCTITNDGSTTKAKQKITFTPTVGTAVAAVWNVILNGITHSYTDDGTGTPTEICNGLRALITASMGGAITTPAGTIGIPAVASKFTLTGTDTLIVEAATAGVAFDYSVSVTGAGAGTGAIATAVTTADSYGLRFEEVADVASGILEKLASQTWRGTNSATGVASYFRLVLDSDTGGLSTTEDRIQGQVSTANADLNFKTTQFDAGDIQYVSDFPITAPAS